MSTDPPSSRRLSTPLMVGVFALLFGVLVLGYFLFLRPDYVAAFSELRPADASAVTSQLDAKQIPYRLADGGSTILVPTDQADVARLAIAGSDVALKGGVGFELFNKSDMGLTDFAQRINYQRALQGELERSIMMIDEVETARVHLAMPERTIFRSERSNAKAAVELILKPGQQFDDSRVTGVQRLVAFAVSDLTPTDVVVLDGNGRVLSQSPAGDTYLTPEAEEQRSMQGYYRARARAALLQVLPGVQADVRIAALGDAAVQPYSEASTTSRATIVGGTAKPARNFRLRVVVATGARLNGEDTTLARNAIVAALALNEEAGDELSFQVGTASEPVPSVGAPSSRAATTVREFSSPQPPTEVPSIYLLAGGAPLIAALLLLVRRRRGRVRLTPDERDAMVERVRSALRRSEIDHGTA